MKSDPFFKLIKIMQENGKAFNPPSVCLGEVISQKPLSIKIGDLQINKENILIADYLLEDYERNYKSINLEKSKSLMKMYKTLPADNYTMTDLNINSIEDKGKIKFYSSLKKGDLLAIIPTEDRQTFVVLCKVVSP